METLLIGAFTKLYSGVDKNRPSPRRIVVVRQSVKRKNAPGKHYPCLQTIPFKAGVMVDGNQSELAGGGSMTQLPGTCGLRESHQGVDERLRVE